MGGLFSSSENKEVPSYREVKRLETETYLRQRNETNGYTWSVARRVADRNQRHFLHDYNATRAQQNRVEVARQSLSLRQRNEYRTNSIEHSNVQRTSYDPNYFPVCEKLPYRSPPAYRILQISNYDPEYHDVKKRFTNRRIIIDSIEKIENKFLELSYSYKKQQKLELFPDLEELELFHGTKWIHADSICTNNFNWRLHGTGTGQRFGQGVSFSCNAMYASNYSKDQDDKVMFIAKVLIGETCLGDPSMILPEEGSDTSTKQDDNIVIVKYEDNEFYPIYRIRYHMNSALGNLKIRNSAKYYEI
ncbi:protein mono-ADP-ribosyltransferase PARP12-like [Harmonia axyridis]|uniref:protein mono-ADP-ribosyltransferase PARP12-like n=1 Tax=Harmonia axyridis TaxID=115357 RepID=UPI001E27650E|nr:protein mono-ADP-ribosyltransferase PARP12-like [Harmonia axyridis]